MTRPRPAWQEKRREEAEALARYRAARPISRDEARAKDQAVLTNVRRCLELYPDHSNAPIWRAVLERGWWGLREWRAAAHRTVTTKEREPVVAQGSLFG